jgi:hypothetical protein
MLTKKIGTGYTPHVLQRLVHQSMKRFNVLVCHRRFGKTVLAVNTLIDAALRCDKTNGRYAYIAPLRKQAKDVAWDYLKLYTQNIEGVKYNESELRVDFANGARITLYGADNPDSMRGLYLDGAVMDEVAQMKPSVWHEVIRPALADRKGWILFIGTPKGINLFYDLYHDNIGNDRWYCKVFPIGETLRYLSWLDEQEIAEARAAVSDAQARQEWDCDWNASSDDTLITIDMVTPARGKHLEPDIYSGAPVVLGVDVARFGDDRSCIVRRQGLACFQPDVHIGLNNMQLADRVMIEMDKHNPDAVFIDAGRGEGVIDRCRQMGYQVTEIPFGGKPRDEKRYVNRRIEMWDGICQWLKAGGALPPYAPLIADLVVPTFEYDAAGRMKLEAKKDMKKRMNRSPDIADALALTFANPVKFARGAGPSAQTVYSTSGPVHTTNDHYDPFA